MPKALVYQRLAQLLIAVENCRKAGNGDWLEKHTDSIGKLVADTMPSGSGWDCGTKLDVTSNPAQLVFSGSFHHMDENGSYDGWTDHSVIVRPSLAYGLELRIAGRDRNDIKEYLHELFEYALTRETPEGV